VAALSRDALWIQDAWPLRRIPLSQVARLEACRGGKVLLLTLASQPDGEKLRLAFPGAAEGRRWLTELEARRAPMAPDAEPALRDIPEGVLLLEQMPDVPHEDLGEVVCTARTARFADRGLQLGAGMRGADAAFGVFRGKCNDAGSGNRHANGRAVRLADPAARGELRQRSYSEQVAALVRRMLLLLVVQAALLALPGLFCAGATRFHEATGQTPLQALPDAGIGLALLYTWPLLLLLLLRILRWPTLLRTTGAALVAVTAGRGLMVRAGHLLAAQAVGAGLDAGSFWFLVDPVDWAFLLIGVRLGIRAWRLADDARFLLPPEAPAVSRARTATARALLGLTALYALGIAGLAGFYRYQADTHLMQPGVDPKREQEALVALNQGLAQARNGELEAAERSLQRALKLWEELTAGPSAPAIYRINLATTLFDLGCIHGQKGRLEEEAKYYRRALDVGACLVHDPRADDEYRRIMADAQRVCDAVRSQKQEEALEAQERTACRKFEEAGIKDQRGEPEAERLYEEAIAAWEEILPQATVPDYRTSAVVRLAGAYLTLAELQQRLGKPRVAEAALRRSIEYGEKAVREAPDRPLATHTLQAARQELVHLREQAWSDRIDQLLAAGRVADALEHCLSGVEEMEEHLRSGQDRDLATRRLAFRLDHSAWLLAQAPEGHGRNTRKAVAHARRAVDLAPHSADFRFTLATVQHWNGDWRESLASLELIKTEDNRWDARHWFLISMNRSRLNQKGEAQDAFRKGNQWIAETERKAATDLRTRLELERLRPTFESLRGRAEELIQGKDPASRGIG
jgi:tetratricopeptide (TPR) repeat protein